MLEHICEIINANVFDVKSNRRTRDLTDTRAIISAYLRTRRYTFTQIGKMLNRDHSTIVHAVSIYQDVLSKDRRYTALMERLVNANPSGEVEYNLKLTQEETPYITYQISL